MGLDMFAHKVHPDAVIDDFSFKQFEDSDFKLDAEIKYWRKNNALHAWMEKLYIKKGGSKESFNCEWLRLTEDDLYKLELDIRGLNLEPTEGFFWGELVYDKEMQDDDLEFVALARKTILEGNAVYYYSWW
jgi:hypothetical protein